MIAIKLIDTENDSQSSEFQAAKELKEMIEESIQEQASGTIYIVPNATLVGQSPRDVDIIIAGELNNCIFPKYYTNNHIYPKKDLIIDSFCIAIELKQQSESNIRLHGTNIEVAYNGSWKNATAQNEGQRYSVINYFDAIYHYKPWTSNFIWLKSLNTEQIRALKNGNPIGALPGKFSFKDIVDMMILQNVRIDYNQLEGTYHIKSSFDHENFLSDFKRAFADIRQTPKGLTLKKLNIISQNKMKAELSKSSVGKQLTVFSGRAGTGKTFRLIQSALQLANPDTGERCLLLTYNHALVSDIRRLLHFMNIPDGIDNYTVQIKTLHSFFMELMKSLDISTDNIFGKQFEREYNSGLKKLDEIVRQIMDDNDIKILKEDKKQSIDWDYILIDEGQDWNEIEKNILFAIYGANRIIVADGEDQFIRSVNKLTWQKNVKDSIVEKKKTGLRQKANLAYFANALAGEMDLSWKVKPNNTEGWGGGHIYIYKNYTIPIHHTLEEHIKNSECDNYDMLFLVPPEMVNSSKRCFKNIDKWAEKGIYLFDGTSENTRQSYPTDVRQFRMFQYESCRGLEGWITVCLHFDELFKLKMKEAKNMDLESIGLESKEETAKKYAALWSLMPLTRAIDTLIITLKDENSEIGKALKSIAEKNQDYVHWEI